VRDEVCRISTQLRAKPNFAHDMRATLFVLALGVVGGIALMLLAELDRAGRWDGMALAAAFVALWAAPGWLAVDALLPERRETDAVDRAVLALAAGLALLVLTGWWTTAVWGHLSAPLLVAGHLVTSSALAAMALRRGARGRPRPAGRAAWAALVGVVVFGAALRLPNLGYSELQGDEAIVLAKAAALVDGRRDAYLVHKKGPAEILIAAQAYALRGGANDDVDGRIDERAARLPFALAMLVGLAAFYALGRAMFGWRVALVAGMLLGLNGFFVAFGRVVQYQAVVFALSAGALLCAFRLSGVRRQGGTELGQADGEWRGRGATAGDGDGVATPNEPGWWLLAALLLAVGILAHYDAALAGPAILVLAARRWRHVPGAWRADRRAVAAGAVLGAVLLAAFFVPLVSHPYFRETTLQYLVEVRLGGGEEGSWWLRFPENLRRSTALATFYSPVWYGLALVVLAVVEVGRRLRGRVSPGAGWWAVLVWWLVPLGFYFVLVESPRTHFHVAYPAWVLIASLGAWWIWRRLEGRALRAAAGVGAAALVAACGWYAWYAFLQHDVEYRRDYPEARPAGFPLPVAELPSSGWFGFPYRAGWKAIGALYADGTFSGDYDSNEEPAVTAWYTRGAPRCFDRPRYAFVAEAVQDVKPLFGPEPNDVLAADYVRIGAVTSGGRERIALYERRDLHDPAAPPIAVAVEDAAPRFDLRLSGPRFDAGLPAADPERWIAHRVDAPFGGQVRLVGWSVAGAGSAAVGRAPGGAGPGEASIGVPEFAVRPGARLVLTLVWRAEGPIDRDWNVFAHVEREGEGIAGQSDGPPEPPVETVCGSEPSPVSAWPPDAVVEDRRAIAIDPSTPPGDYDLLVGLYDYATLDRLPVLDASGAPAESRVRLAVVRVTRP